MTETAETPPPPLPGPVTIGEFRARLAEMTDRVLAGEEVTVMRGAQPVARFVPVAPRPSKRFGTLNEYLSEEERLALDGAISADLSEDDRRTLAGEGTDELGIWKGLPRARRADGDA